MKRWLAILLIAVLTLSLFGCDQINSLLSCKKDEAKQEEQQVDPRVGIWTTKSVTVDGRELTQKQIENNAFDLVVTLKDDGTGTLVIKGFEDVVGELPITYTDEVVSFMGVKLPYTLNGNTVTADYPYNDTVYTVTLEKSN